MSKSGKAISTDVLIIGGGIAGLCAANKAVNEGVNVLIAEKGVTPWTGQIPAAGGSFPTILPEDVEARVKYIVEQCQYLNDQDWVYTYARDSYPTLLEMAQWGDLFQRDTSGKLMVNDGRFPLYRTEMCLPILLGRALKKGAKVLNRVYMVDLLQRDGRVVGAVGFHYQTGDFYVIRSKATIIACGACNYKSRPLFHMNCGEGVAMAYNAGAEFRNMEFMRYNIGCKFSGVVTRDGGSLRDGFENALGEKLAKKYPELMDQMRFTFTAIYPFYKEIEAGRGPIYLNLVDQPELAKARYGPDNVKIDNRTHGYVRMMQRQGIDVTRQKVEWTIKPPSGPGPIRVDLDCQSTVPGLYAVGDAVGQGTGMWGALPTANLMGPLGFVVVTGFRAGKAAARSVASVPEPVPSGREVEKLQGEIFAPLNGGDGYSPYDAIREIQAVVFPFQNSYVRRQDRLEKALAMIEKVQAKLPKLKATDAHELVRCHEAKSMARNAEVLYRAALLRTETRGSNIREDYPERDDEHWLKWITIRKEGGKMNLKIEPVPLDTYKIRPPQKT